MRPVGRPVSQLVVEPVHVVAVVGGLAADEHVVVSQDLLERQQVVVVVVGRREQVVHLFIRDLTGEEQQTTIGY